MDMTADGTGAAAAPGPLGILAGGGGLPEQIAERAVASGRKVHIVAITGEAEQGVSRFPHTWVNWGSIGRMSASLKSAGCRDLIIVGSVTRPDPRTVRPDFGLIKAIPTIIRLFGGGDDHVLRNVVRFFEAQGFAVRGVADVAPELLMPPGTLGKIAPASRYTADAARGLALIDALGSADVGQAVVMRDGRAVAIEAAEGTDRMLARLGVPGDPRAQGGVLVKAPKPGQELRIDMPVIGPRTIENAAKAGLAGIAVQAGRVLVAERDTTVQQANTGGLFVTGIVGHDANSQQPALLPLSPLNRRQPDERLRRDMARASRVLTVVSGFAASAGVVVVRRHVIAIETGEGFEPMLARVRTLRQWGATARSKRRGAIALGSAAIDAVGLEAILATVADAGLAGVVLPPGLRPETADQAGSIGQERGLAVVALAGAWPGQRQ
jgi:UDP-2,3-diacylglucosamine hydrolase